MKMVINQLPPLDPGVQPYMQSDYPPRHIFVMPEHVRLPPLTGAVDAGIDLAMDLARAATKHRGGTAGPSLSLGFIEQGIRDQKEAAKKDLERGGGTFVVAAGSMAFCFDQKGYDELMAEMESGDG